MLFKKRGNLAINQIILLIIALVVLIVILYMFRSQMTMFMQKLWGVSDSIDLNSSMQGLLE